ncbi:MAG TPA: Ig-like domain-containing protein, partial [Anaerolineae bacterium]
MRLNRALAIIFAFVVGITPLLAACQRQPQPGPLPAPAGGSTAVSQATAQPAAPPTAVPTPTPTRAPLPPLVVDVTPAPGAEQPLGSPLVITFDQAMDPASTGNAFSIEPSLPGKVQVEGSRLAFAPDGGFARAASYQVRVAASAASANGLKLVQPVSLKVNTAGYLEVSGNQPADKAQDVAVDTPITVSFNRPVVPLTGVAGQASLPEPLIITPTIAGKGSWISTSIYQFNPANGLAASTAYSISVKAGLTDTAGALLQKDYRFGFTTNRPTVTNWQPELPNWGLKIESPITVTFSMPMDHASAEAAFKLAVIGKEDQPVTGTFTWNQDASALSFKPARVLEFGTRYQATVATTARSASGQGTLGRTESFSFKTVSLPAINRTNPTEGNRAADPAGSVLFQFAAPMDPASFISGTVTVLPRPTQVYTNYNQWDNSFYVTFDKLATTAYTVTLAGSLADPYGNRLGKDFPLHFKTGDYPPLLDLANAGIMGTYNAYTDTEAVVSYRNVPTIGFALSAIPLNDFLGFAGQHFGINWSTYSPPRANLIREWQLATKAERNTTGFLRAPLTRPNGDSLAPGLYFLRVDSASSRAAAGQLFARTNLNITLKTSDNAALAWVTDLKSGQPVAGAAVRFTDGQKLDQTITTGQDGVAQLTLAAKRQTWDALVAIATAGDGRLGLALSDWDGGISPWDFNLGTGAGSAAFQGYVYTDRPIYRPGQTVYWKAIVRRDNDALYSVPAPGQAVTVTINDDRGNKLFDQRLALTPAGTLDGKLALGRDASLGYYFMQVQTDKDNGFGVGFQVAEYRKPEYQISVDTDKPEYVQGQAIKVTVKADYFFGGPVKNAKVHWSLLSSNYNFQYQAPRGKPAGFYSWNDWDWYDWELRRPFGANISQGDGSTDDKGQFNLTVPADIARFGQSQRFTIDLTLIDANNQGVSAQATAIVHKGAYYIGLQPQSYVATTGEANQINLLTVDPTSRPIANTQITVVANRVAWYSVRQQAEDGRYYWNSQARVTPVFTDTLTTATDGTAVFKWTPDQGGEYKILATGRDQAGNTIRSATFAWVTGPGYVNWR